MIKYKNSDLLIEIKEVHESLESQVDALERILKMSTPNAKDNIPHKTPEILQEEMILSDETSAKDLSSPSPDPYANIGIERSMKKRIPNVLDLNDLNLVEAKKYKGFRCPNCNQSYLLNLTPLKVDTEPTLIIRMEDGIHNLTGVNVVYDDTEAYDKEIGDHSRHIFEPHVSEEQVFLTKDPSHLCSCVRCKYLGFMDEFIEDFEETSSEFDRPCLYCGGEVVATKNKENESALSCEQCKSEVQY